MRICSLNFRANGEPKRLLGLLFYGVSWFDLSRWKRKLKSEYRSQLTPRSGSLEHGFYGVNCHCFIVWQVRILHG
jgi:hypothetical protein